MAERGLGADLEATLSDRSEIVRQRGSLCRTGARVDLVAALSVGFEAWRVVEVRGCRFDWSDADTRSPRRRASLSCRVSLSCEVIAHPHRPSRPLELGLENLHVEVVLVNLLLAGALGLGLVALLVHEHADLMRSSHALDCLGLEVVEGVARWAGGRLVGVANPTATLLLLGHATTSANGLVLLHGQLA
jgi:hypothetical protein